MAEGNNTRNPDSPLFKRLTRLFSGPIINYRSQNTRQLRRRKLDKYARTFRDVAGQKFERSGYNPLDNYSASSMDSQSRLQRCADFDQMEYTPELASALDIYADEMTTFNVYNRMIKIQCPDEEIKQLLESLFYKILNIEFNLFGWARTMCKYGDFYLYLDIDSETGISNVIGLPTREIERIEGQDKDNPNYIQFQWNSAGVTFENWQVSHFRILGNDKFAPYGTSVLDPARRIWRQLTLLEDAMMAYRIVRSPERRVFKVDVGNIPPQDVEQFMQKFITSMKRNQIVDPDTGRVDLRYNPMSVEEDYFIPIRGGVGTTIESLPGGTFTGDIDDVKYLRDKMFAALKIPISYMVRGEGSEEDKGALAQKDIRFARTVQRLQRSLITELEKLAIIHLYVLGFRNDDLLSFKLKLNNPSKISEMQELENWRTKFDVAGAATDGFFSKRWIANHLFDMSDEEFLRNQREIFFDMQMAQQLEGAAAPTEGAFAPAGGSEFDMTPEEGALPDDQALEGGATPEASPGEAGPDTDESALLAMPDSGAPTAGKRDDTVKYINRDTGQTTTNKSKAKAYNPVKDDKRDMGARKRQYVAMSSHETARMPSRQIRMNLSPGARELLGLGKGIFENKKTSYEEEERTIFEVKEEVKKLFDNLEQI
mgnify:CR=1 FL=1|tara:strand:- start:45392 stop:47353 length:1962 start_codon:yes stop_codon:yes gene_type:complete